MATKSQLWPRFDSLTLQAIVDAFKRRSKAVRYAAQSVTFARELDEVDGDTLERFNLDLRSNHTPPVQTRLSIWTDGEMWLRICQAADDGWKFIVSFWGSIDSVAPETLVELLKQSSMMCSEPRRENVEEEIKKLWHDVRPNEA